MAKILFLMPPWQPEELWDFKFLGREAASVASLDRPLGLVSLAAYLRRHHHEVEIVDCPAENILAEELGHIFSQRGFDILGINISSQVFYKVKGIAAAAKAVHRDCWVVVGGAHVTGIEKTPFFETLLSLADSVDFAISGEGEIPLLELARRRDCREHSFADIGGLIWRDEKHCIRRNPSASPLKNLDQLPFPAFDLLKGRYRRNPASYRRQNLFPVSSSRGCPYRCAFCSKIFGTSLRQRSVENVFEELVFLKKRFAAQELRFVSEIFTWDRDWTARLCRKMAAEQLGLIWSCYGHINCIDEELAGLMKRAGCWQIDFGIESGDQEILKNIGKPMGFDKIRHALWDVRRAGITSRLTFILGLPGETEATIMKTINYAVNLDPDYVLFYMAKVYPGSELFSRCIQEGRIKTEDVHHLLEDGKMIYYQNANLPLEKVAFYIKTAHRRFYGRLRYIFNQAVKMRSWEDVRRNYIAAKALMRM